MAQDFATVDLLRAYLNELNLQYGQYAQQLWNIGVRSRPQLRDARHEDLVAAGVLPGYASNMKASAAGSEQDQGAKRKRGLPAAPAAVSKFWEMLTQATVDGKFFRLANGTHFLGDVELGSSLYLRDCYAGLETLMKKRFETDCVGLTILGNAGIGKSMLGYLLLYRWAKEGLPVVLRKRGTPLMLLCPDGAFILETPAEYRTAIYMANVRYLVDGLNPMDYDLPLTSDGARTVLLTSQRREVYWEFTKRNGYDCYMMDIWSWEELEECLTIYPRVTTLGMRERFDRWGGIPRYVLERTSEYPQTLLHAAIESCTIKFIEDSVEVAAKAFAREKQNLRRFISAAVDEDPAGGYRGQLWEGLCHRRFPAGGTFKVRDGGCKDVSLHTIDPCPSHVFFDTWEVAKQQADGTYCQPRKKNTAAVDAAIQPATLLQITVSDRHGVICVGLTKAVGGMKANQGIVLYFVVPPNRFEEFKAPQIDTGAGVVNLRKLVHLRVLEFPI